MTIPPPYKVKARIEALAPAIAFAALALSIDNAKRVALDINAVELAKMAGIGKRALVQACEPLGLEIRIRVQNALERAGIDYRNLRGLGSR